VDSKTLQRFVHEKLAPKSLIEGLDCFVALRAKLVPAVGELAISPIALLAGDSDLLAACEDYLKSYEQVLRQLHTCYHDMHGAADTEAEAAVSQLLALETYVFRRDDEFDAMMSPLHPLALWRSATLVREIRGLPPTLSPHEAETVARACTENAQFLQVLLLPPRPRGWSNPNCSAMPGSSADYPSFARPRAAFSRLMVSIRSPIWPAELRNCAPLCAQGFRSCSSTRRIPRPSWPPSSIT
jgi:hypothetical protein